MQVRSNSRRRPHLSLKVPHVAALVLIVVTLLVGWTTTSFDSGNAASGSTPDAVASFPSQRDFQQSMPSDRGTSITLDGNFVYSNTTYHYRYSTKLFSKSYPVPKNDDSYIPPSVIYGVCANAAKPVRRQAIRKSWGLNAPVYFLVAGDWETIEKEFTRHGDLLWLDIPESYRNALTPKTFGFLHFASRKAIPAIEQFLGRHVDYMFKTDDDVYINTTEMSRELHVHGHPAYFGLQRKDTAPIRNNTKDGLVSKWYMSKEEYPYDIFPPYAHGTGYAVSKHFVDCAVSAMPSQLFMPWEDVATGMLAEACGMALIPSDKEWSHFLPFDSAESEWAEFPYHRFKNGNVLVKILHKVKPWFFEPLSRQGSLVGAREYGGQKRHESKQRRESVAGAQKRLPNEK